MSLAIALHLGDFVDALALGARLGVLAVERLAVERLDQREHDSVAEIPVVRDRQHLAARLLLVGFHPFPQIARIGAARRVVDEGLDLPRLVAVVAEQDVAVHVRAVDQRGPLVADESRELARIVGFLRGLDDAKPGRGVARRPGVVHDLLGEFPLREGGDDVHRRGAFLTRVHHVVPLLSRRIGQELGLACLQIRDQSHLIGVVRHDQKIERARQLRLLTGRAGDFLALGEAIRIRWHQRGTGGAGVHRQGRVQVCVTEEHPCRVSGADR